MVRSATIPATPPFDRAVFRRSLRDHPDIRRFRLFPLCEAALRAALDWARSAAGPILLRISVSTDQPKTDFFLEDPVILARQFEAWLR